MLSIGDETDKVYTKCQTYKLLLSTALGCSMELTQVATRWIYHQVLALYLLFAL